MNDHCIFCKIAVGQIPAQILYQDEFVTAFQDIHPVAPVHVLVIPNQHIESVDSAQVEDEPLLGKLITSAGQIARNLQIDTSGYRLVINTGPDSGQSVYHLHVHILGGRQLSFQNQ